MALSQTKSNSMPPGRPLECGCCGLGFRTWAGYVNQGQDRGYGICAECQGEAVIHNNEVLDAAAQEMRKALRPDLQTQFDGFSQEKQRFVTLKMIERGHLEWRVEA